jgi:hypothetical protein
MNNTKKLPTTGIKPAIESFFVIQVNDLYRFSLDQIENIVVCNKKPTVIRCDSIEIKHGNTL